MATKKKLGHQLKIGDTFLLPQDKVEIIGFGNIAHSVVSEEGGKILCYRVKAMSGPFKGESREVILLGNGKVQYVLKDPILTRLASSIKARIKSLFKKPEKKKLPGPPPIPNYPWAKSGKGYI